MAKDSEDKKEAKEVEEKKKGKGLLIGIVAGIVVVLLGGGVFAFKFYSSGTDGHSTSTASHGSSHSSSGSSGGHSSGHSSSGGTMDSFYSLDPFIVNLQDNVGTRYLKLTVQLELDSPSLQAEIESHLPKIRDAVIILLSSKSYADIGTVEGKYRLRDEIVQRVNKFLSGGRVKTAYFTDFVIQ